MGIEIGLDKNDGTSFSGNLSATTSTVIVTQQSPSYTTIGSCCILHVPSSHVTLPVWYEGPERTYACG